MDQLYPVITCDSVNAIDILKNLENSRIKMFSELDETVHDLEERIKDVEILNQKSDDKSLTAEILSKLYTTLDRLKSTSSAYKSLVNDLRLIFEKLTQVEVETESQRQNIESSAMIGREPAQEIEILLEQIKVIDKTNTDILRQARLGCEAAKQKICEVEPAEAATLDVEKLNAAYQQAHENWTNYEKRMSARLKERLDYCALEDELDKINAELKDLAGQLSTITGWLGENLGSAKGASEAFTQFEKTLDVS